MLAAQGEILSLQILVVQSCLCVDITPSSISMCYLRDIATLIKQCESNSQSTLKAVICSTDGEGVVCTRQILECAQSDARIEKSRHLDEFRMRPEFIEYMYEYLWAAQRSRMDINRFLRLQSVQEHALYKMGDTAFFEIFKFGTNLGKGLCLAVVDPELFFAICAVQKIVAARVSSSAIEISPSNVLSLELAPAPNPRDIAVAIRVFSLPTY